MRIWKKIVIGVLIAALVCGGVYGVLMQMKKSNQTEVMVVSVSSLKSDYYMPSTTLEGNVTTNVAQNITVDDDMIIDNIYVQSGDTVSVGDPLISFDMTLVEMELKIMQLKAQKLEQDLTKATNRLYSLQNGGPIEVEDSSADYDVTGSGSSSGSSSNDDMDDMAKNDSGSAAGGYLAAAMRPMLLSALDAFGDDMTMDDSMGDMTMENSMDESMDAFSGTEGGETVQGSTSFPDVFGNPGVEYEDPAIDQFTDGTQSEETEDPRDFFSSGGSAPIPTPTPAPGQVLDEDFYDEVQALPSFTDGVSQFYRTLDYDSQPFTGTGTEKDPYIFLCSVSGGSVRATGAFFNRMAGYNQDGTEVFHQGGYWFQIEFHENDVIADYENRTSSCIGYYLIDGGLLKEPVDPNSEMELTLEGASQFVNDDGFIDDGMLGGDLGGDTTVTTMTREEAIKAQKNIISSLELSMKKNDLEITKLEKKVNRKLISSKLEGIVDYVGDAATGSSDEEYFMRVKSKDGFYVTGTVSELMLDQLTEGTILNCMSYEKGNFEAKVLEVSDYPMDSGYISYMGDSNPNVSYYTYSAEILDQGLELSEQDWLTITLDTGNESGDTLVLPKSFVRTENGSSYVYKDDGGVLKKQAVKIGANVDGGYSVIIESGITVQDSIAFPYGDAVKDGAKTVEGTLSELYGY